MHSLIQSCLQECEVDQARGIGGTGQGFDAPSAGKAGGKGFGARCQCVGQCQNCAMLFYIQRIL